MKKRKKCSCIKFRFFVALFVAFAVMFVALISSNSANVYEELDNESEYHYLGDTNVENKYGEPKQLVIEYKREQDVEETKECEQECNCSVVQNDDNRFSDQERYLLAKIAECEAGNQSIVTKQLVILCVLNRVGDDYFPNTIEDVIMQPYQFSPIMDGSWESKEPTEESYMAVENVENAQYDISYGCLFFEALESDEIAEASWFGQCKTFLYKSDDTRFYK